ncbi:hypothetical protein ACYULU_04135 [Breznakiellaceae bacterium SP9]
MDTYELEDRRIFVYWSQTMSERGYALNARGESAPTLEFNNFLSTFETALAPYSTKYYRLRTVSGFLKWAEIAANEFEPKSRAFYELGSGSFENHNGPLTMLYQQGLVNPDDLTVVVTDLEEQRLKNHVLANTIRKLMSFSETNKYAAAIIALKLPFRGNNYKPDPTNDNNEITQPFVEGEKKPLYIVVTSKKDAVAYFTYQYEAKAQRNGLISYTVSTLYPSYINKSMKNADLAIPESAGTSHQTRVDKNDRVLDNLYRYRNEIEGAPRLWNLNDQSNKMVDFIGVASETGELTTITKLLNLKLFQYKAGAGSDKNGHKVWQLNILYNNVPQAYDAAELEVSIDKYQFLLEDTGQWDENEALLAKDLEFGMFEGIDSSQIGVFVGPREHRTGQVGAARIIRFDVVINAPLSIPDWVSEFNDDTGIAKGRTWNFNGFVASLLGIDDMKNKVKPELARTTLVLFDVPSSNRQDKKK